MARADLTCVDICKGDTVSDVVARLAEKLCECCGNPAINRSRYSNCKPVMFDY